MAVTAPGAGLRVAVESERPLDLARTLGPLRRGAYDPTLRAAPDGALWRTSRLPTGPVTYRLVQTRPRTVVGHLWGPGADEGAARLPALLGRDDAAAGFAPPSGLAETARRHPGIRVPATGQVLEALIPAILEQRVVGVTAFRAWAWLLGHHGEPAPGPDAGSPGGPPPGMRVVPDAAAWARVPTWDWHRAGVDPGRARTAVECARRGAAIERLSSLPPGDAQARLRSLRGVGAWTAAEVAQRAWGDADAVSVGDYHLAKAVIWAFDGDRGARRDGAPGGHPDDDARMLELLEPYRPHRYRVVLLLKAAGRGQPPRRGPRMSIADHRTH
ncbi:hypothetical protein GCM10025865_16180 [Paraoerskovia sediminicola]|uniref:3-methyladenine DNA glycosylase/8-oxoguanine DNA glycosylase n=1 Tax=Paraoerskovia sediminicola TaxID=1138587 RepID=A0ABN6XBT0_9CELL|nr:DNA-3-methyladenine glycosylase 2 family protein [Paraoerskovia sediminicola]BDZ42319.1 hypothetical protein GCM10025865_16180 [Paraoerskovia sediminicola]